MREIIHTKKEEKKHRLWWSLGLWYSCCGRGDGGDSGCDGVGVKGVEGDGVGLVLLVVVVVVAGGKAIIIMQ